MPAVWITASAEGALLRVLVVPRASRTTVVGPQGDHLKVKVAAPPVDDAANEELTSFLAKSLGLPRGSVVIRSGSRGRRKLIQARGISALDMEALLTAHLARR